MKILIALHHDFVLWNAPEWLAERLRKDFPEHQLVHLPGYEGVAEEIADAEVAIAWSIRPKQFAHARKLKWVHSPAAAVHQLMFPQMVASDVLVTNAREIHGPVVAEHALALIFALAKRLPSAMRLQQARVWGQQAIWEEKPTTRELADSTVCLIGMGSIGREFTKRARALGMRVVAVREHPEKGSDGADSVLSTDDLEFALSQAEFVVLAAPLTPATRHIINAERLRQMKKEAYLINVSRGPLIDDAALITALKQNQIAGAGLDVFEHEPLPADSPYWRLENVLITPHTAAVTEKLWARHYEQISENIRRYLAGEPPLSIVDKQKGY
ncbi:MAG: D-isomer specific 2-hydroxyacid dehydrogenase, NAD-binding protein [Acidobacteriaceae bacterium]|nr:D-isomer specific 2-hydroxyacid dehydrogenase, NAD-binding protein [Acidobacteriaceae bacterium]